MKKREKAVDILKEKKKKNINFGNKSHTSPLMSFFWKKRKKGGGGTITTSATGVANGSIAKHLW